MKIISVGNTVKIYEDATQRAILRKLTWCLFLVVEGICIEDEECNLRGDIQILILFEKHTEFC